MATIVWVGILYVCCELYLDDMLVDGKDENDYFDNLEKIQRLSKHNLTLNPDKGVYGASEYDFVGHHITHEDITQQRPYK